MGDKLYCLGKYEHTKFDSSLTDGSFESNVPKIGEMGFQKKPNGASVIFDRERDNHILNKDCCEECGKSYDNAESFELHHIDFDRHNNYVDNFKWCCNSCHKKIHYKSGRVRRYEKGIPTYLDEIISIKPHKVEQTYHVTMADPYHNFLTNNGFVPLGFSQMMSYLKRSGIEAQSIQAKG